MNGSTDNVRKSSRTPQVRNIYGDDFVDPRTIKILDLPPSRGSAKSKNSTKKIGNAVEETKEKITEPSCSSKSTKKTESTRPTPDRKTPAEVKLLATVKLLPGPSTSAPAIDTVKFEPNDEEVEVKNEPEPVEERRVISTPHNDYVMAKRFKMEDSVPPIHVERDAPSTRIHRVDTKIAYSNFPRRYDARQTYLTMAPPNSRPTGPAPPDVSLTDVTLDGQALRKSKPINRLHPKNFNPKMVNVENLVAKLHDRNKALEAGKQVEPEKVAEASKVGEPKYPKTSNDPSDPVVQKVMKILEDSDQLLEDEANNPDSPKEKKKKIIIPPVRPPPVPIAPRIYKPMAPAESNGPKVAGTILRGDLQPNIVIRKKQNSNEAPVRLYKQPNGSYSEKPHPEVDYNNRYSEGPVRFVPAGAPKPVVDVRPVLRLAKPSSSDGQTYVTKVGDKTVHSYRPAQLAPATRLARTAYPVMPSSSDSIASVAYRLRNTPAHLSQEVKEAAVKARLYPVQAIRTNGLSPHQRYVQIRRDGRRMVMMQRHAEMRAEKNHSAPRRKSPVLPLPPIEDMLMAQPDRSMRAEKEVKQEVVEIEDEKPDVSQLNMILRQQALAQQEKKPEVVEKVVEPVVKEEVLSDGEEEKVVPTGPRFIAGEDERIMELLHCDEERLADSDDEIDSRLRPQSSSIAKPKTAEEITRQKDIENLRQLSALGEEEPQWLKKLKIQSNAKNLQGLMDYLMRTNKAGMVQKLVENEKRKKEEDAKLREKCNLPLEMTPFQTILRQKDALKKIPAYSERLSTSYPDLRARMEQIVRDKKAAQEAMAPQPFRPLRKRRVMHPQLVRAAGPVTILKHDLEDGCNELYHFMKKDHPHLVKQIRVTYMDEVLEIPEQIHCHLCKSAMRVCMRKSKYRGELREYPAYRCLRKGCQTFKAVKKIFDSPTPIKPFRPKKPPMGENFNMLPFDQLFPDPLAKYIRSTPRVEEEESPSQALWRMADQIKEEQEEEEEDDELVEWAEMQEEKVVEKIVKDEVVDDSYDQPSTSNT